MQLAIDATSQVFWNGEPIDAAGLAERLQAVSAMQPQPEMHIRAESLRQAYECWKAGADPIEWAREHREFGRAFDSFPGDADKLYPGWREKLAGVHR